MGRCTAVTTGVRVLVTLEREEFVPRVSWTTGF
jgi:hypothetical protein